MAATSLNLHARAWDVRKGDTYEDEDAMRRVRVRRTKMHGDTVLIWGMAIESGESYATETTLDGDESVVIVTREATCQNCRKRIHVDHISKGVETWLHNRTGLGECDRNAPFGPGACPPEED